MSQDTGPPRSGDAGLTEECGAPRPPGGLGLILFDPLVNGVTTRSTRLAVVLCGLAVGLAPRIVAATAPPEEQIGAPLGEHGRAGAPPPRLRQLEQASPSEVADLIGPAEASAQALGLQRREDGSYFYADPARRFTLVVTPRGEARFADRWKRADARDSQHGKCCGRPAEGTARALNVFAGVSMNGPLEWAMKARGLDPAAAAKAEVLERTRTFRTKLAVAWTREQVERALGELPRQLEAAWSDGERSAAVRKQVLFEHWDACEDRLGIDRRSIPADAIPQVDEQRHRAARAARAIIVRFVREHLPAGSADAFTPTELAHFNARRVSVGRFTPYASRSKERP